MAQQTVEEVAKNFNNEMAFQLTVSNDTMKAVRLARKMVIELITKERRAQHIESYEKGVQDQKRRKIAHGEAMYQQGVLVAQKDIVNYLKINPQADSKSIINYLKL